MKADRHARLVLSVLVEPGDARLRDVLGEHAPAEVVAALEGRHRLSLPRAWRERLAGANDDAQVAERRAAAMGFAWVTPGERHWPAGFDDLAEAPGVGGVCGAPLGLWVRGGGDLAALWRRSVAIVGARACTGYGADVARDIAADLADAGHTVVSGAAYGIDAAAHRGALSLSKPTVAVLAGGVDVDYPRAHGALLSRIAQDGCVVSEHPPGQAPLRHRFLSRNRLIAAMTSGTLVVEAARRSGSLNTLNWADQLGRVTMATPGPVHSQASGGVHEAIRGGMAVLVCSGAHVVEELEGLGAEPAAEEPRRPTLYDELPVDQRRAIDALPRERPIAFADVVTAARLDATTTRRALSVLSRRGLVAEVEGRWILLRRPDMA